MRNLEGGSSRWTSFLMLYAKKTARLPLRSKHLRFCPEKHYIKILGEPGSRGLFSKKWNFCLRKLVFRVLFVSKIIACQSLCMFYFVLLNFPVLNCRFCAHVLRNCVGVVIFRRVNSQFYTYHYVPPISRRAP